MPGRRPKARHLHERDGTFRKDRHAGACSPAAPAGRPALPKSLDGDALQEWHRMIARLEETGVLSVVDDAILYQHCRLFAETEHIHQVQQDTTATMRILQNTFDGMPSDEVTREDAAAMARVIDTLRKLEAGYITKVRQGRMALGVMLMEMGLTPSTRHKVRPSDQVRPASTADAFTAFQHAKPSVVRSFEGHH